MSKFKIALASLLIAGSLAAPVQASSPEETPSSVEDRNSNVGVEIRFSFPSGLLIQKTLSV